MREHAVRVAVDDHDVIGIDRRGDKLLDVGVPRWSWPSSRELVEEGSFAVVDFDDGVAGAGAAVAI